MCQQRPGCIKRVILGPIFYACILMTAYLPVLGAQTVAELFASNMVLQRDRKVPIWGTGKSGENITVVFAKQKKKTRVGKDGTWRVELDELQVGDPETLMVLGTQKIIFENVLVGEVWFGSGQSNMFTPASWYKADSALTEMIANPPKDLRIYYEGKWQSTYGTEFSALLFAFGVHLQKNLQVPVGLAVAAQGSTASRLWLTPEMAMADAALKLQVEALELAYQNEKKLDPKKRMPGILSGMGSLYEKKVRPFNGLAIRGVLWDQGESDTGLPELSQHAVMQALIHGWRNNWGQDFHWLCIQKPSGGGCAWDYTNPMNKEAKPFMKLPASNTYSKLTARRDQFARMASIDKTVTVPASDLVGGLHPKYKSVYGQRAADVAMGFVYKSSKTYSGPMYVDHRIKGGTIAVKFTHVGKGLAFKHGSTLQGFEIAGEDGQWQWATHCNIVKDVVMVTCAAIKKPVHVRYAWHAVHPWANLFNKDGLPAFTFSTQDAQ